MVLKFWFFKEGQKKEIRKQNGVPHSLSPRHQESVSIVIRRDITRKNVLIESIRMLQGRKVSQVEWILVMQKLPLMAKIVQRC